MRSFAVLTALTLMVASIARAEDKRPAPPPLPNPNAPKLEQPHVVVTASKEIVEMFLRGMAAVKYCAVGGQDSLRMVAQTYGLSPEKTDPAIVAPIMAKIEREVQSSKSGFCRTVWQENGSHGSNTQGLLTKPGASRVDDWMIEPTPIEAPTSCVAYRDRQGDIADEFDRPFEGPHGHTLRFTLQAPDLETGVEDAVPITLQMSSQSVELSGSAFFPQELEINIASETESLLRKADVMLIRVRGREFRVPLEHAAELFDKLTACQAENK